MKHGFIKTAAATPDITVADCNSNGDEILRLIRIMEKEHVKVMVFPELCITGYTCQDLFLQRCLLDSAWQTLLKIAGETVDTDALIFVGLPVRNKGKLYNVAAVLNHGKILGLVPKSYLPNYGEFYEQRHFYSGAGCLEYLDADGEKIPFGPNLLFKCEECPQLVAAAEICEDLWVTLPPSVSHAQAGANLIVNLSASNEMVGKDSYRRDLVRGQSARLVCGYVYANAGEGESTQDLVFGGQNMIAENGVILAEGKRFHNEIVTSEIDVHRLNDERRRLTTYQAAMENTHLMVAFHLKMEETKLTRKYPRFPFVPSRKEERDYRCDEILNIQAMGLKKRMDHIHCHKATVGLSGGLDSTLALLVIARAIDLSGVPRSNIHCITMPCFGTTDRTYQNACKLSRSLGASLSEINIKEAVNIHFRDIGHDPSVHDVTYENSQARERTQILMDSANQDGSILVGTGDLSELALGWATYNGDHMSMYGVNASVPKTLVRHLVRYYADTCGDEKLTEVLLDILDTPVSPELLPPMDGEIAQKTEDLVGPYELHDFYLYYMLRAGFEPDKIFRLACDTFEGIYSRDTILKWLKTFYRRFFAQQFKRSCLPDGPKVGSVAVSPRGDLRMPSDASAKIWQEQLEKIEI
ncbi:MAG: NAD(+) synthase [Clostridia bacterium]|nr:NAD(+) synthase [Clostridia bacterium]MDY5554706.1 NAD(+) synthase [Blautia sp.]